MYRLIILGAWVGCGCASAGDATPPAAGGSDASHDASSDPPDPPDMPDPADDGPDAAPSRSCSKMDVVFVIDDSASMGQEQSNLVANFPAFIQVLDDYGAAGGESLDYRVAVTTTGRDMVVSTPIGTVTAMGANGAFASGDACGAPGRWLSRGDPGLADRFACIASVGTDGPPIEMPLHALELAFSARLADGTNAGFRRDDALLAVVVLTDEDDCSRSDDPLDGTATDLCNPSDGSVAPVADYVGFLDALTGDRARWAAAVIAGPGPGSCTSQFGTASEAVRLKQLVDAAGPNGVLASICSGDLSAALLAAVDTFDLACESFPPIP